MIVNIGDLYNRGCWFNLLDATNGADLSNWWDKIAEILQQHHATLLDRHPASPDALWYRKVEFESEEHYNWFILKFS